MKILTSSKPAILQAAVELARTNGLLCFSRQAVAKAAKVAEATVSYHFGHMVELRKAVFKYATQYGILSILADAAAARESFDNAPVSEKLKQKIAAHISR